MKCYMLLGRAWPRTAATQGDYDGVNSEYNEGICSILVLVPFVG